MQFEPTEARERDVLDISTFGIDWEGPAPEPSILSTMTVNTVYS